MDLEDPMNLYVIGGVVLFNQKSLVSVVQKVKWNKWLPKKINISKRRIRHELLPTDHVNPDISESISILPDFGYATMIRRQRHIFLECVLATKLWSSIFNWLNARKNTFSWQDWVNYPISAPM